MSKPDTSVRLPAKYDAAVLTAILRDHAYAIGALSDHAMRGTNNAYTAAPTGTSKVYEVGDFVRNSGLAEAGAGGSKYLIVGWVCTVAGAPGTWLPCRALTGN